MKHIIIWLALLSIASPALAKDNPASFGVWSNPQNSVHVRAQPCGAKMCGVVVWANEKAKADALRGGTDNLIGLILFRDFVAQKAGIWRGRVFVPDIGHTFLGTITMLDDDRLEGKGCLAGRIGCKSQIWTRLR